LKAVVTGGAGFIGSHLVDALLSSGYEVTVVDNLSSGSLDNLRRGLTLPSFKFVKADLKCESEEWIKAVKGSDVVFHFAANPEVRVSYVEPRSHFEENLLTTFNVLEACRKGGGALLVFASSSTVYGEAKAVPTPEYYYPLEPISIYGACKLACEELVTTYSRLYGIRALILRYANIVGPRCRRGVIADFISKLSKDPSSLEILGDGSQRKSYLYIDDAINATLKCFTYFKEGDKLYEIFNVGNEDWITVKEIADVVVKEMGLTGVNYRFKPATPEGRGWPGDVKYMLLDISKLKSIGWEPKFNSREAVKEATRVLLKAKPWK